WSEEAVQQLLQLMREDPNSMVNAMAASIVGTSRPQCGDLMDELIEVITENPASAKGIQFLLEKVEREEASSRDVLVERLRPLLRAREAQVRLNAAGLIAIDPNGASDDAVEILASSLLQPPTYDKEVYSANQLIRILRDLGPKALAASDAIYRIGQVPSP